MVNSVLIEYTHLLVVMSCALVAGSLIGLERSYHGGPAGFRTHALVCVASAILMLATTHQSKWFSDVVESTIRTDPTRMAQGIMTGIGFLGAGVIFKEGFNVRGLTTAASIWMTAALGILYGIGLLVLALAGTLVALAVLAIFRLIEFRLPTQTYLRNVIRLPRDSNLDEDDVRRFLQEHGFSIEAMSYRLINGGRMFEYQMVIRTSTAGNISTLAETLRQRRDIFEYTLSQLGD